MTARHSNFKYNFNTNQQPSNNSNNNNNSHLLEMLINQNAQILQLLQNQNKSQTNISMNGASNVTSDSGIAHTSSNSFPSNQQMSASDRPFEQTHSVRLKNQYIKKIKFEDHLKNARLLMEKNKCFPTFNANRFFTPFLPKDEEYKQEFTEWLKKIQREGMEMVERAAQRNIENIEIKIAEMLDECGDSNKSTKASDLLSKCELDMSRSLKTSFNKTQKVINSKDSQIYIQGDISESWFKDKMINTSTKIE